MLNFDSYSALFFFKNSKAIGAETKIEEYVPTKIPTNKAKVNPRIESPPKMKMANNTTSVDIDVLKVRRKVLLIALSILVLRSRFGCKPTNSRMRSKIITVSLME